MYIVLYCGFVLLIMSIVSFFYTVNVVGLLGILLIAYVLSSITVGILKKMN